MLTIRKWVRVTPDAVLADGAALPLEKGESILTSFYRKYVKDYPKFFKMDNLSKLGFIASEALLLEEEDRFVPREDRAVILFNESGSFASDSNFQKTISDPQDFFPSPSVFVYTLPNIVTGEIAIRNRYYGETSFYVLESRDLEQIVSTVNETFLDDGTLSSAICGWTECGPGSDFDAFLFLVGRESGEKEDNEWNNKIISIEELWKI